ncbi:TRAP transporter large permease [Fuscovulum ytuae]|uniref:TRAP transporter large permease subunit n=1 Tax=Fuscovulum ytuae TaxID=3042299 RepID=A0ABY8Q4P9_9RHOB|nr:TRAP transporter large permease subunit [Fuscovulum sp. YMD61]WGV15152.1 TRAP transporter large permease subunit [Fuscovulum sp. YMD61]
MIEFIALNLAPIMFASLVIFLILGYPVAFALAANGLLFFFIGVELAPLSGGSITLDWPLLNTLPNRIWGVMSNETLLAIPFFTFMGIVLERSGMAEDLLDTIGQLFGPIRGGVAYAVILVGALLAATTGVVAASVIAMGLISLPIMLRYGYDRRVAAGTIAASGTLAQIVPPSLVLIVLADQLGRSVGDMYHGAILPALILVGLYMAYVFLLSIFRPNAVPALPPEVRTLGRGVKSLLVAAAAMMGIGYGAHVWLYPTQGANADVLGAVVGVLVIYGYTLADKALGLNTMSRLAQQVIFVLIPPLALIFLVLGTIFIGLATPTEAGAMGAVGALVLAFMKRRLKLPVITQALAATTRLSAFVMFILIGARVFSLTFYGVNGHVWVEHLLTSVPGGEYGFLFVVNVVLFVLGFFLDFFELVFIIVPLIVPAADALGIDLIWLGVILAMNMQTSFLTPPFGFALFYLRSVAPKSRYKDTVTGKLEDPVRTDQIYAGAIPFIVIQMFMVVVVILFPQLVLHYKAPVIDPSTVTIEMPTLQPLGGGLGGLGQPGGLGGGLGAPAGLQPPGAAQGGLGAPPALQPQGGLGQPPALLQPGGLGQPPAALQAPAAGN